MSRIHSIALLAAAAFGTGGGAAVAQTPVPPAPGFTLAPPPSPVAPAPAGRSAGSGAVPTVAPVAPQSPTTFFAPIEQNTAPVNHDPMKPDAVPPVFKGTPPAPVFVPSSNPIDF